MFGFFLYIFSCCHFWFYLFLFLIWFAFFVILGARILFLCLSVFMFSACLEKCMCADLRTKLSASANAKRFLCIGTHRQKMCARRQQPVRNCLCFASAKKGRRHRNAKRGYKKKNVETAKTSMEEREPRKTSKDRKKHKKER